MLRMKFQPGGNERRQLMALAREISAGLKQRFGSYSYYSAEEIESVCADLGRGGEDMVNAIAMFSIEQDCITYLQKIRSSRTAGDLRMFLAGQLCGGNGFISPDDCWDMRNPFHDIDGRVGEGASSSHGFGGGGFSDSGGSSGSDSSSGGDSE